MSGPAAASPPITTESVGAKVYQRLRLDLMRSRFRPGEKLKLRDLAQELGVSSTPVRDALARLVSEGALEQFDHRSVRVPVLSDERFREIVELRAELEGKAAARAAERARPADADRLAEIHARMTAARLAGDGIPMLEENERFHMEICALSGMPVLTRIIEGLWLQCGPLHAGLRQVRFLHHPDAHPHHEVIRALREQDGALARLAVQRDISVYAEVLLRRLPEINIGALTGRRRLMVDAAE
ncbi:GntR family transcriptional regulator [Roseomonas sp. E05]|uniref:GntR family transcriptional regulator n=1 Tax=Roseomonas sp. E05 TaxID=3046310 RepID=UPI0024BA3928|nr:GntR family transcriptional regulator [Roseomonas sp. E05]MDJ0390804.1 GntR family transcriptional regulator [Roseomonas sp. E05]